MSHVASITKTADTANAIERTILRLTQPLTPVLRLTRIRYDEDGWPLMYKEVVLPLNCFPGLAPNGADIPDIFELAQRHGHTLGRATERVSIVAATTDVAFHLRIAAGTDVLKLDRVIETTDGVPIQWRVAYAR